MKTLIPSSTVVAEARGWVGTPFRHQGRARHGIDCIGLAIEVAKACGVLDGEYGFDAYPRTPQSGVMLAELRRLCFPVGRAAPGTLIVCQWHRDPQHVAIVADGHHGPTLIHALQSAGKVVEHGYDAVWQRVTKHVFALPGVRYGQ
ncbi:MAG TPA: NlpC/P60 family protein [Steroidobacteraceae bacterium]|nr:NlpC/P60 family protein [Steroidobacteraceae bacterium]